ncbi:MFS transporter [Actinocatenispora rupis]|uniref:MFS transporter n=1 Tax=Actinocatenispora rupis TaxID=519421 RepID=A0A8J3NB13_9ACTN|nr:MFS transporter [Actinocatenispora rupis]GID12636.1 MFS transporter [Actinocatenispora rupis]
MTVGVDAPVPGLTSSRRDRIGWYFYDWANHAFITVVSTVFLGPYLIAVTKVAAGCGAGDACTNRYVHPLGIPVAPGSYFSYLVAISTLLTVVVLPVVGALADRSAHKKRMLVVFAYVGAAATTAMVFVTGGRYLLGGVLFLVANISLGAATVVYNSFLPQLAGPEKRDSISSIGWSFGYLGGGLLLALSLVANLLKLGDTLTVARYCIVAAGLWWGGFTLVTVFLLPERHEPVAEMPTRGSVLGAGFRQLGGTLRGLVKSFPLTVFFLVAFLIYNDGIQTVISQASVYGTNQLQLSQAVLLVTILVVQIVAFGGALLLGRLAKLIGARKTVLIALVCWIAVIVTAFWLPAGKALPFIGLGVAIGLVMGGSQALSRSLYSQLIPTGKEAEYFGIYAIGDKGTSWLGSLLFGLVYQFTFNYRLGIVSLLVFFVLGFVLLAAVPMRRAIQAAGNTPPRLL